MRKLHGQRGAVLVEFGIAATLVFIVLMAIIQFGQALAIYNTVANGSRLGSRYAIVRGSTCTFAECPIDSSDVQTYVRSISANVDTTQLAVTATWTKNTTDGC